MPKLSSLIRFGKVNFVRTLRGLEITWTLNSFVHAPQSWIGIAMSADGTKQTAVENGGKIYTSTNSGATWILAKHITQPNPVWGVAMSADGTKQTVMANNIHTSNDSGVTWTINASAPGAFWTAIAMSADGTKQTGVTGFSGNIYTSTDSGVTWTPNYSAPTGYWADVAMSADGTKQTAAVRGGYIYTSTDSGVTWTHNPSAWTALWTAVAMSADGSKQTVVAEGYSITNGYHIHTSTDSGVTWTINASAPKVRWQAVAMSADGTKQTALAYGNDYQAAAGKIYTSTDSGVTWTHNPSATTANWQAVAMSADGTKQTALSAIPPGGIYNMALPGAVPVINSALSNTATLGAVFSYQISAENSPTSYSASNLPAGLNINTSTGVISGTPTSAGVTTININATNARGTGTASLELTASYATPAITSSLTTVNRALNSNFSYNITASNRPTNYAASGLPPGVSVNTSTGVISGTPTAAGTYTVTISATNPAGTGSADLSIPIVAAPVITSSTSAITARTGTAFSYQITATNSPTSYSAANLPTGLSVNTGTGTISGTPNTASETGVRTITVRATNVTGTGTTNISLTLEAVPSISNASINVVAAPTGTSTDTYQIQATSFPGVVFYNAFGSFGSLPGGMSFASPSSLGQINGVPNMPGTYTITIEATNAVGKSAATLTVNAAVNGGIDPPRLVSDIITVRKGIAFTHQIGKDPDDEVYQYGAYLSTANNNIGTSINTTNGIISGNENTVTQTIPIFAFNAGGTGTGSIVIVAQDILNGFSAPVVGSLNATAYIGLAFSYQITATNSPTGYYAVGLPAGLSINTSTGLISGTYSGSSGTVHVKISVNNEAGSRGLAILFLTLSAPLGWILNSSAPNFTDPYNLAMSGDGVKQALIANQNLYVSSDSGKTWTIRTPSVQGSTINNSARVSISNYGNALVITNGYIFSSSDFGLTWVSQGDNIAAGLVSSIAMSGNGTKRLATKYGGYLMVSNDSGNTWTSQQGTSSKPPSTTWESSAVSITGSVQTAVSSSGRIYTSYDSGVTWVSRMNNSALNFVSIAISDAGIYQTAVAGYSIYVSSNYGETWTLSYNDYTVFSGAYSIAMTKFGEKQFATSWKGGLLVSNDYGVSWTLDLSMDNIIPRYVVSDNGSVRTAIVRNKGSSDIGAFNIYNYY